MKLTAIRLHNVRSFVARGIAINAIGDGVNVLAEANEYGKSTIFDAVHALFFQSHKGKGGAIKALQPYSGGAVTVEAEIETGEDRFRLSKRWLSKAQATVVDAKTGRVIAQADEADRWIDARMRGGAAGPAGLLWVQQGSVEMGKSTGKAGEIERTARQDVLTSVSGEIEALTGGRRMAQVMAKCSAELAELVTISGKPKAGGPLALARDERDTLQGCRDDLAGLVAELRAHLDQRSGARRRLAELQDEDTLERDRRALVTAERALIDAEAQAEKLERADLAERLARQEAQAAAEAHAAFEKAIATVASLRQRIAGEETVCNEATQKRDRARQVMDRAVDDFAIADEAVRRAENAVTVARKAELARNAVVRLAERRQILTEAEAAAHAADEARASAAALDVPKATLARLDQLAEEIAALTAERRASSTSIRIAYAAPDGPRIRRDGTALPGGEAVAVDGSARFDIDGVGTLTVSSGTDVASGDLGQRLATAGEARAALLQKIGVDSAEAARERARKAGEYAQAAALATARCETLAPKGLDALRTEVATLQAQAEDLPKQTESLDMLVERHRVAADTRAHAEAARDAAQTALNTLETALASAETNLARSREAFGRDHAALGETSDPEMRLAELARVKADTAKIASEARSAADALRANTPDLDSLRAAKARAESVLTRSRDEVETLGRTIGELNGRIGTRAEEGIEEELADVEGRLSRAEAHLDGLQTECAALQRLIEVLTDARAEAKEHFFAPVMAELRPLLSLVFGDAAVTFDEKTLLPVSVERGGEIEQFDVLSGGMREQITILTRLAFARLLAEDGRTVPVILDDALIYSDDARIERMFDALHRQATDLQILVFTCRQRAFRALGGREMQVVAWSPEDAI